MNHPNVAKYFGSCEYLKKDIKYFMIYEWIGTTSLHAYMKNLGFLQYITFVEM